MPAVGVFIENFSDDRAGFQQYQGVEYAITPGFDSWDNDPATMPPAADELHIVNDLPSYPFIGQPLNGPVPGGYYNVEEEKLDRNDPASPPVYFLRIHDTADPGSPEVSFLPQLRGVGGGLEAGEKVAIASVAIRGVGAVTIVGAHDTKSFPAGRNYQTLSATANELGDAGRVMGPIQRLTLRSEEFLDVDNVSFLVLEDNFPPDAQDDAASVFMGESVTFNWKQNDSDQDNDPITLVSWTQPARGRVAMDATGSGSYVADPDPAHVGRYTFEYTISDGRGRTDTATVFLDVTNNHPPVASSRYFTLGLDEYPLRTVVDGPFRWEIGHDVDGDGLAGRLTQEPLHGEVRFRSLPPDESGRSRLEALYVPYHPYYGPYDGSLKFSDRFAFTVDELGDDGTPTGASDHGVVQILAFNPLGPPTHDDEFILNLDQPVDPLRPGQLLIDAPGVLANDDDGLPLDEERQPYIMTFPGRPLYAELVSPPAHALFFRLHADGSFEYQPDPEWVRAQEAGKVDSFTYRATDSVQAAPAPDDGHHDWSQATVTIRITTDELNEQVASRRYWSTLVARADHVHIVPGDQKIRLTTLLANDVWREDAAHPVGFVIADERNPHDRGLPNGIHLQFLSESANATFGFVPAAPADEFSRHPNVIHVHIPNVARFPTPFDGVTFGRYRLIFKDGDDVRYSNVTNFYITGEPFDRDGDGITDWTEGEDAAQESNIARLPNGLDRRPVTLTARNTNDPDPYRHPRLMQVQALEALPEPPPPDINFPIGFFSFGVTSASSISPVIVRIDPPPGVQLGSYWKFGRELDDPSTAADDWKKEPHWYEFTFDEATQTGAKAVEGGIELYLRDGQRGDDDLEVNGIIHDPGGPAIRIALPVLTWPPLPLSVAPPPVAPPTIQRVVINNGHRQRSRVKRITVTFSDAVMLNPGAFELTRRLGRHQQRVGLRVTTALVDGKTAATLTFRGPWNRYGSLPDGNYRLTIRGVRIHDRLGRALDGDGDGAAGGAARTAFFRRYGDTDGDRDIDRVDVLRFWNALGSRAGQRNYLRYLDDTGDGVIDHRDVWRLNLR